AIVQGFPQVVKTDDEFQGTASKTRSSREGFPRASRRARSRFFPPRSFGASPDSLGAAPGTRADRDFLGEDARKRDRRATPASPFRSRLLDRIARTGVSLPPAEYSADRGLRARRADPGPEDHRFVDRGGSRGSPRRASCRDGHHDPAFRKGRRGGKEMGGLGSD